MVDHGDEISLAWCLLLNAMVFGSAWRFASRRMTASRSQAVLDAALFGYVIQYAAVGLPGMIGQLRPVMIFATAIVFSTLLFVLGWRRSVPRSPATDLSIGWIFPSVIGVFTTTFLMAFVQWQASLPVIANDALTYHFPAAAQWLQHGRIDLYQTWFFNPANTFSPLAGSTFIVWLIAPFGSDVLARFVEVPALLCVGLAVYRLARQLGSDSSLASLLAAAAILCRPVFLQSMMGKDDLFLAFFVLAALIAMTSERTRENAGSCRLGAALGMLLATKYTAFLTAPIFLLAITPAFLIRWRQWIVTVLVAALLAGPWYFRNWRLTGNPIFPLDISLFGVHLFQGQFTSAASDAFIHPASIIVGGSYGLPTPVAMLIAIGWLVALAFGFRNFIRDPLLRAAVLGPPIGIALFYWKSPFPEVRFVVPEFLLMFAATSYALQRGRKKIGSGAIYFLLAAALLPIVSLLTIFVPAIWLLIAPFAEIAVGVAVVFAFGFWLTRRWSIERLATSIIAIFSVLIAGFVYVDWTAYYHAYQSTLHGRESGYALNYAAEEPLWRFVDQNLPADTTAAYSNLYLTYPLYGFNLQRHLAYAPTRAGVRTLVDLPWLGSHLSGEKLVSAAARATAASPDLDAWLGNLKAAKAKYLIIGRGGVLDHPPEEAFAREDSKRFHLVFSCPSGCVFEILH